MFYYRAAQQNAPNNKPQQNKYVSENDPFNWYMVYDLYHFHKNNINNITVI